MFKLGEQKVRPGVYVRWYNDGGASTVGGTTGVAAAVIKSNWGPTNTVNNIGNDLSETPKNIGTGYGPGVVRQIIRGGATEVLVVRAGKGGDVAKLSLEDTEGLEVLKLNTKYPTSREFNVTIREAIKEEEKELIVYEGTSVLESFTFEKGENESGKLVDLIKESSVYLNAQKADSDEPLELVVNEKLTGGSDPELTAQDYVEAFNVLERKFFDGITVDALDPSIHASLQSFVNRNLQEGSRIIGVVGEKIDIPFETRLKNARSFNSFSMVYVGNGFVENGTDYPERDGALAAGRVLGEMVSRDYKDSLTKKEIQNTTGVNGELTPSEYVEAAKNGMMVFSESVNGFAQVDYGINTLVTVDADEDEGWKKIRRVRTRFELIDRIAFTIANAMSAGVDNSNDGRQYIITLANGIIEQMISDGGLESGEMIIDDSNPPEGDSVWFKFDNLVDLDGIEKVYLAFGFRY